MTLETYNQEAQQIREKINARPLTDFYLLEKSQGGMFVCPICGSGTHKNKSGALSIRKEDNRVTCFAGGCFGEKGEDTLGALRKLWDCSEKEAFEKCGYPMTTSNAGKTGTAAGVTGGKSAITGSNEPQPQTVNLAGEIEHYAAELKGSPGEQYLVNRGFTLETMQLFKLGYNARQQCVTIPYNQQGSYYGSRSLLPEDRIPEGKGKFDKLPESRAGKEPLFNGDALYSSDVVFITEGAFDAISIIQEGGAAVALNGTGHKKLIAQLEKKPTSAALVLCLDNDEAGRTTTARIEAALEKIGAFYINGTAAIMGMIQDPADDLFCKDPNEVLQKRGADALRRAVEVETGEARRLHNMTAQEAERERRQRTGAGMIEAFFGAIQSRRYEPIATGISDIDRAIGGGFMRQQLVLLGGAPGAGKTACAQWIFEGMAERGAVDVVYLNLEMSREQMLARSIARIAARNGLKIPPTTILQGYQWTDKQRRAILSAAFEYQSKIAPRLIYNPDNVTADLDSILAYIEAEARRAEKAELPAPVVVLDYLQYVTGDQREDAASLIKRAVSSLKSYAVKHNTLVLAIIAHQRASNRTGAVTMESGRDTSALEYSADLQLGLTFTECLKRGKSPDDLTAEERKAISLKIVKGRFGGIGRTVELFFDGETMTYGLTSDRNELDEPPRETMHM